MGHHPPVGMPADPTPITEPITQSGAMDPLVIGLIVIGGAIAIGILWYVFRKK